ncbi:MAG TPA: VOC family protein [Solirubrobacteraceae bacterium]|nr:VOC family protein [Solirubrobacteraceae bacterium]
MFDHVGIRVSDRAESERFYTTVLAALGIEQTHSSEGLAEWEDFALSQAAPDRPLTQGLHIGFVAPSREHVDAFHRAGVEAGYRDDGAPGPRPQYQDDYYGSFLLDPDGNSAEAVHRSGMREGGWIDHLWLRTQDVAAIRRFYEAIGFSVRMYGDDHVQIAGDTGSFSYLTGEPTRHVHIAFPAPDNATVEAFHRTATEAGYRDNGAPGERGEYHPGYYGAFVLDPDGHNIELVNHNR